MLRAIRAVAYGESLLGPTIAQKAQRHFSALPGKQAPPTAARLHGPVDLPIIVRDFP
jgi:hypothetical protein